jgi:hypothetical protein
MVYAECVYLGQLQLQILQEHQASPNPNVCSALSLASQARWSNRQTASSPSDSPQTQKLNDALNSRILGGRMAVGFRYDAPEAKV